VVYIYSIASNTLLQLLTIKQSASTSQFSGSMGLSGSVLAVGDYTYNSQQGAVFVLVNSDTSSSTSANFSLTQVINDFLVIDMCIRLLDVRIGV
jgi:hypothetical protein